VVVNTARRARRTARASPVCGHVDHARDTSTPWRQAQGSVHTPPNSCPRVVNARGKRSMTR
jgi:hypothetical protein